MSRGNGGGGFPGTKASGGNDGGGFPNARGVRRKMAVGDFQTRWASGGKMATEEYETYGDLRVMKINGNRNGMMGGDIGTLDETMNNKRKLVLGC